MCRIERPRALTLAILLCGRLFQTFFSLLLCATLLGWPWAALWVTFVVGNRRQADREADYARMTYAGMIFRTIHHELTNRDPSLETFVDKHEKNEAEALAGTLLRVGYLFAIPALILAIVRQLPRLLALSVQGSIEAIRIAAPAAKRAYHNLPEWT